jgi:hypothetical protein
MSIVRSYSSVRIDLRRKSDRDQHGFDEPISDFKILWRAASELRMAGNLDLRAVIGQDLSSK